MQRKRPIADVSLLYSCPPRIHLDPDFQINLVAEVYVKYAGWKEEDARAAAERFVAKCRKATER